MKKIKKFFSSVIIAFGLFVLFCVLLATGVTLAVDHWGQTHEKTTITQCDDHGNCTTKTTSK